MSSFELSFSPDFFFEEGDDHFGGETLRPTTVYAAVKTFKTFKSKLWDDMCRHVFGMGGSFVSIDQVMEQIRKTNACRNLTSPVEVYIDTKGWYSVLVYEVTVSSI